jgi:uncharacterized protein (TIGR03435 family)
MRIPVQVARRRRSAGALVVCAAGLALALVGASGTPARARGPAAQTQAAPAPQWQIDAGGKMSFDVASVKQNTAAQSQTTVNSNIPLGPQDMFTPTGGLLSATNYSLLQYMVFAYKLTNEQVQSVRSQLPKWATSDRYDIQAREPGNPTKDQFRLAMQSLLADRFKLAVHFEVKQQTVLAMVLDKPGKLGPHLQLHPADQECSTAVPPPGANPAAPPTVAGGFPEFCGFLMAFPSPTVQGQLYAGARNVQMSMIATTISSQPALTIDTPVIDRTEITGKVDFYMLFTPVLNGSEGPDSNFTPDPNGPTFAEALKQDLGLKLESQTGPVTVIVIDHVEEPSAN